LPFSKWGIDFIQDVPRTSDGFENIITAVDLATKFTIAKPVLNRGAATVANFIYEEICCRFGAPAEIVTDRAKSFLDSVLAQYLALLEIHHLPSTPYTPRTNGACERMHRTLKDILTKLCAGDRLRWKFYLPQAVMALNARVSNATGFSPFYLCHGVDPVLPGDELPPLPPRAFDLNDELDAAVYTERELAKLGQNRAAAMQRLKVQAAEMKRRYDLVNGVGAERYRIGDVVKLKHHRQTKFQFAWYGPFYVDSYGPNGTYYLKQPDGKKLSHLVNHDYLAPFSVKDPELYFTGNDQGLIAIDPANQAE
jgi:hypothetical protein